MNLSYLFLYLFLMPLSGENVAGINGTIIDLSKKPIGNAEVFVIPSTHPKITSDESGKFSLTGLEPGQYTVVIIGNGFAPWARRGIRIEPGQIATLDVTLSRGVEDRFMVKYLEPREKDLDSFSPALKSFDEPAFCSEMMLKHGYESYRFLWMRSFHHPVLIELINRGSGNSTVTYRELNGKGGYSLGRLIENKSYDVYKKLGKGKFPEEMVQSFVDTIYKEAELDVWKQPYELVQTIGIDGTELVGMDGATWTIEAVKNGKCHVVTRWSPNRDDSVRRFAETLIDLTDKRFYYDEFY
jgi:hypothetical protein